MRKWIHALTLTLALSAAFPSAASTISIAGANDPFAPPPAVVTPITGADGPLAPGTDYTLPYRADGIFDFSAIDLGAGITLRFDPQTQNARLLSLGDILVAGMIDASGINLALETPGRIVVAGSISAGSISLANAASLSDRPLRIGSGGRISLSSRSGDGFPLIGPAGDVTLSWVGGGLSPTRFSVPEPATPWLIVTLLPLLMLFGRRHTSHGH
ncbi:MAG TPA: PEP-CTERM sorting domain-containing protein [Thiobacillus sp.]